MSDTKLLKETWLIDQYPTVVFEVEDGMCKVLLTPEHSEVYGDQFTGPWLCDHDSDIGTVIFEDYESDWNLEEFYFLPLTIVQQNHEPYYDLMSEREKQYFKDIGKKMLQLLMSRMLERGIIRSDLPITGGATLHPLSVNHAIADLVRFYQRLSFEIDYKTYSVETGRSITPENVMSEIVETGKEGHLKYVPIITNAGRLSIALDDHFRGEL